VVASSPSTSSNSAEPVETPEPASDDESTSAAAPEPEDDVTEDDSIDEDASEDDDEPVRQSRDNDEPEDSDDSELSDATDDAIEEDLDEPEEESPGKPIRLQIDSIDIDAAFEYVGIDDDGNMDVPQDWDNVAWYEPGTIPGDRGNAVVAGHYDSYTDPAVFFDLNEIEEGDEVRIITEDDEELIFEVTEIELVHVDDADTSKIFGKTDERNLNLITCEGVWDTDAGMYDQRLIVYTTLVSD
jgi:sortase A